MANLRILGINAADSRTVKVRFSNSLSQNLVPENITIQAMDTGVPNVIVQSVDVSDNILIIGTLPMTPYAKYNVIFSSTSNVPFVSADGQDVLVEQGNLNSAKMLGAEDPTNPVRDELIIGLSGASPDSFYDFTRETKIRTLFNDIAGKLAQALYAVRQAKNENYLSVSITDEQKTRGFGPWDRLNQEGAYEIVRVGTSTTNDTIPGKLSFSSFPNTLVSLQQQTVVKETLISGISGNSTYDGLTLTLANSPVIQLLSLQINYQGGGTFVYNISQFGYLINNPVYDQYAKRYVLLNNNQIQLSAELLDGYNFVIPGGADTITVSYNYKNLGIDVDPNSVSVYQIVNVVREVAPAETTLFSTDFAPIVDQNGNVLASNGIQFLDPYSLTPFQSTHLAFLKELPFRQAGLPSFPGQYCVDYSTGRVFCYGAVNNDGTGYFPPVMNYSYNMQYMSGLDYTYNSDTKDLVASPIRYLTGQPVIVSFNFGVGLVPNVDYVADVHQESRNERILNNLGGKGLIYTQNAPLTDVFRIYNESTGEIYSLQRFEQNKIYFNYNTPPNIQSQTRERASFTSILNEELILYSQSINSQSVLVFKFILQNQNIISGTEDCIGSSFNSSATFSHFSDVFMQELYFDYQQLSEQTNINRLSVGQYQINYAAGIVYVGVSNSQVSNVGFISYRSSAISPQFSHVLSVSNVYYSLSPNQGVTKVLDYTSFGEGFIQPSSFDVSDERFFNDIQSNSYDVVNNQITVTDDIKYIRNIFDFYDLTHNTNPINFLNAGTFVNNVITLNQNVVQKTETLTINSSYQLITTVVSPGIALGSLISIIRLSDGINILNGQEVITGNVVQLVSTLGRIGDVVNITYTVNLTVYSTPVLDYNKGDFFVDYTYLLDEILVSYEYGDNVVDFRQSTALSEGDTYYVTYKVGALRDALLNNFASVVQIPILQAFDEDIDREVFRSALQGAFQTFTKGPTVSAMKQLISSVTKIEPELTESLFDSWTLASSYLAKIPPKFMVQNGSFGLQASTDVPLVAGKYDQGLLINQTGQGVIFPASSNLRLEEGTLEMFVIPEWNGLDNDASITFNTLMKDGYELNLDCIYIGSNNVNPSSEIFSVNKTSASGVPSKLFTNSGIFIYYDTTDAHWNMYAKDVESQNHIYSGNISTSGSFYDVSFADGLGGSNDVLRSDIGTLYFSFDLNTNESITPDGYLSTGGVISGSALDGILFMSDNRHYLIDFGKDEYTDRFCIYKDGRGYLVFEVWDSGCNNKKNQYRVSADISSWKAGIMHHVAVTWSLNSYNAQDEMHLFIDGLEVPNIAKYGNIPPIVYGTNRFRTVIPEQLAGITAKTCVTGNDMVTTIGSNIVSTNFSLAGINTGDSIQILEQGFSTYTINHISGGTLTLNTNMPASLNNAVFSINPISFVVQTEIDIYTRIGVYVMDGYGNQTEIPGVNATIPSYSIQRNSYNQNVLEVLGNVPAGSYILLKSFGLNHRRCREQVYLWSPAALLKTKMPSPVNLNDVSIKAILLPVQSITFTNSTYSGGMLYFTGYPTQPTDSVNGRQLDVRISADNVDFSTSPVVTISGTNFAHGVLPTSETLTFTSATKLSTVNYWTTITSIIYSMKPLVINTNTSSIEVRETNSVTLPSINYAVIRYAYKTQSSSTLVSTGTNVVSDGYGAFFPSDVGNLLQITSSPGTGLYTIVAWLSSTSVQINAVLPAFTNGIYSVFSISIGRSGFQNGFFFLEQAGNTNAPYTLPIGWYEVDFATYLSIKFDPIEQLNMYVGSDITLSKPSNAVIDELRILNKKLSDVRVGETTTLPSITQDAVSVIPFTPDINTLALLHFDDPGLENSANMYNYDTKQYLQSGNSVNANFGNCLVVKDKGISFDNLGYLSTISEGMIEFWVSPELDSYNDPNVRMYFDATSSVVETVTSETKSRVKVSGLISKVLSVMINGQDYFDGGSVESDSQTIVLNSPLPYQQTPVIVTYIAQGTNGDRMSIFKDAFGYVTFSVLASGNLVELRYPIFWPANSWHRVRGSYKFNRSDNQDQIRLFIDGEEKGQILFGQSQLIFGANYLFGQAASGTVTTKTLTTDINFKDSISQFSLGQDFTGYNAAHARMDNLKISNKSVDPFVVGGQAKDVYWNTNIQYIYPSVKDAYTTFLYDFDQNVQQITDFANLISEVFGLFNFNLNIIDSFGILNDPKVKAILEAMIDALKPATSKVNISYAEQTE